MFNFKTGLAGLVLVFSSILSSVSAQDTQYPEPITLGQLAYPHGHQIIAWSPTRTTMVDACNYQLPSRTVIQTENSGYPSNPLCNYPFALDGYEDLELLCAEAEGQGAQPQVTAIATNGTQTHNCTSLAYTIYPTACDQTHITSIWQLYACQ